MPDGLRFGEIADGVGGVVILQEPISAGTVDFHVLHAFRRTLLQGGGVGFVSHGANSTDVLVGGEGGEHVFSVAGEQVHDSSGEIAGGEQFS